MTQREHLPDRIPLYRTELDGGSAVPLDLAAPHRELRRLAGIPSVAAAARARRVFPKAQRYAEEEAGANTMLSTLLGAADAFGLKVEITVRRAGLDLTPTDRVLLAVSSAPGRTEGELATALGLEQLVVHNALGGLRRAGRVKQLAKKPGAAGRAVHTWGPA